MSVQTLPELKPLNNLDSILHPAVVGVGSEAGRVGFLILYLFKNNKIFISYVFKRE